jgi:hypothetical protein
MTWRKKKKKERKKKIENWRNEQAEMVDKQWTRHLERKKMKEKKFQVQEQ